MNRSDNIQFHLAITDTLSQILSFNQIKNNPIKTFLIIKLLLCVNMEISHMS